MKAIETTVAMPMDEAESAVREALGAQGFGVLTEIDVAATLQAKLGVERAPLKILGACNPNLAHQASRGRPVCRAWSCRATWCWRRSPPAPVSPPSIPELMPDPSFAELAEERRASSWRRPSTP